MSAATTLLDERGAPLSPGEVLGQGGEGRVHALPDPGLALKHYRKALSTDHADKLQWMTANKRDTLTEVTAWPLSLVRDAQRRAVGYLMPRISRFQALDRLSNPHMRFQHFPDAGWAFQLRVAGNLAGVVARLHRADLVVGDLNPSNVLVDDSADVRLIDCDSFYIDTGGRRFYCGVGQGEFLAPELHGKLLEQTPRAPAQDGFALAVLVFQLLFLGRHPFVGRLLQASASETDPMENIRRGRFIFGPEAHQRGIAPPERSAPFELLPPSLGGLLTRMLGDPTARRPTAAELHEALRDTERGLTACARETAHEYPGHLGDCPWCVIDARRRRPIYPRPSPPLEDLAEIFPLAATELREAQLQAAASANLPRRRAAAPRPAAPPAAAAAAPGTRRPALRMAPLVFDETQARRLLHTIRQIQLPHPVIFGPLHDVSFGDDPRALAAHYQLLPRADERTRRQQRQSIVEQLNRIQRAWQGELWSIHHGQRTAQDLVRRLFAIPEEFQQAVAELQGLGEDELRQRHLDNLLLKDVLPPPLNRSGLLQLLESFEVVVAADLEPDALDAIQGLGTQRRTTLLDWRRRYEQQLNPATLAQTEAEGVRRRLQQEITGTLNRLQQLPDIMRRAQLRFSRMREARESEYGKALTRLTLLDWLGCS